MQVEKQVSERAAAGHTTVQAVFERLNALRGLLLEPPAVLNTDMANKVKKAHCSPQMN